MATLREEIQAKIDAASAEVSTATATVESLKAELENLSPSGFLEQEVETLKTWFSAVARHLGM